MEKGFNDNELADIMNEIENLEKEFAEDTQSSPEQVMAAVEVAPESDESFDHSPEDSEIEATDSLDTQDAPEADIGPIEASIVEFDALAGEEQPEDFTEQTQDITAQLDDSIITQAEHPESMESQESSQESLDEFDSLVEQAPVGQDLEVQDSQSDQEFDETQLTAELTDEFEGLMDDPISEQQASEPVIAAESSSVSSFESFESSESFEPVDEFDALAQDEQQETSTPAASVDQTEQEGFSEQEESIASTEFAAPKDNTDNEPAFSPEEMSEVLGELAEMPIDEVEAHGPVSENVHQLFEENPQSTFNQESPTMKSAPGTTGGHSSMSFTVEGDMKLDLNFNISGQMVELHITENGFELQLEGGAKFSIPLGHQGSAKQAA